MSGIGKKATERVKRLVSKYYNPDEAGQKAGIETLNRAGFLFWRLNELGLITPEQLVKADANYQKVTLPWLDISNDGDHFGRFDSFKDMFNYYEGLERIINTERRAKLSELNQKRLEENMIVREENSKLDANTQAHLMRAEKPYFTLDDMVHIGVDPELEEFREMLRGYLSWGSSILMGLSFDNPDDNKTIVLNKPIIMDAGRTRTVRVGGGTIPEDANEPPKEVEVQ